LLHPFVQAAAGGALIGLSAVLLLLFLGRHAGISGITGQLLDGSASERGWRLAFVGGLVAGGAIVAVAWPTAIGSAGSIGKPWLLAAGLTVGYGTRLAGGCTSGHGICGLGRGSLRSLVATLTFMAAGGLTVFLTRHLFGGLS
jgi:uncharacterized membrane protein YedE/YeeE